MLSRIATKLVRADPDRKTRFHDRKGHFVEGGIVGLPYALVTWILLRLFAYRARRLSGAVRVDLNRTSQRGYYLRRSYAHRALVDDRARSPAQPDSDGMLGPAGSWA
jgi:hypothetical protein